MKKRIWIFCLVFFLLFFIKVNAKDIGMVIDGKEVVFTESSGRPFADENSRTLVPLRMAAETCGARVDWIQDDQKAIILKDGTIVEVYLNSPFYYVDNYAHQMDTKAIAKDGRIYLPIRFILEALHYNVNWNDISYKVEAMSNNSFIKVEMPDDNTILEVNDSIKVNIDISNYPNKIVDSYIRVTSPISVVEEETLDEKKIDFSNKKTYDYKYKLSSKYAHYEVEVYLKDEFGNEKHMLRSYKAKQQNSLDMSYFGDGIVPHDDQYLYIDVKNSNENVWISKILVNYWYELDGKKYAEGQDVYENMLYSHHQVFFKPKQVGRLHIQIKATDELENTASWEIVEDVYPKNLIDIISDHDSVKEYGDIKTFNIRSYDSDINILSYDLKVHVGGKVVLELYDDNVNTPTKEIKFSNVYSGKVWVEVEVYDDYLNRSYHNWEYTVNEKKKEINVPISTQTPIVTGTGANAKATTVGPYYGSKHSTYYHLPSCKSVSWIYPENKIQFSTKTQAQNKGYIPCPYCKPGW